MFSAELGCFVPHTVHDICKTGVIYRTSIICGRFIAIGPCVSSFFSLNNAAATARWTFWMIGPWIWRRMCPTPGCPAAGISQAPESPANPCPCICHRPTDKKAIRRRFQDMGSERFYFSWGGELGNR